MRCRPRATPLGAETMTTVSIEPMSMPSSSDVEHTTARSSPRFNRSSTARRRVRSSDAWCTSIRSASAGMSCFSRRPMCSAPERVLVKISVVRFCPTYMPSSASSRVPV